MAFRRPPLDGLAVSRRQALDGECLGNDQRKEEEVIGDPWGLSIHKSSALGITPNVPKRAEDVPHQWHPPPLSMSFLKLTTAVLGATAAITAVFSQPAEAQMYGYGNSYQQNNQPGRLSMPSQSGNIYRSNPPVMQQPNFGQQQRQPSQRGYGHSSGSYFGY